MSLKGVDDISYALPIEKPNANLEADSSASLAAGSISLTDSRHRCPAAGSLSRAPAPLLVYNDISTPGDSVAPIADSVDYRSLSSEQRRGKRLFSTLQSGLIWNADKSMRFLTLTSANDSPKDVMRSFNRLITMIRRTAVSDLVDAGYVAVNKIETYYPGSLADDLLKIEYLAVQTSEGNGVIHALIIGDYLPQKWLSAEWKRIHSAWNVDIRAPKNGPDGNMQFARYILAQYVRGQTGIQRVNCSQNWIYRGWRDDFKKLIADTKKECVDDKEGFQKALMLWNTCMYRHKRPCELDIVDVQETLAVGDLDSSIAEYGRSNYKDWLLNKVWKENQENDAMQRLNLPWISPHGYDDTLSL